MRREILFFTLLLLGILATEILPATAAPQPELPACDGVSQTPVPIESDGTGLEVDATASAERAPMAPSSGFTFEGCFT